MGLSYTVSVENKAVLSWQATPPQENELVAAVTTDLGSMFEVYTNATRLVEKYYIKGDPSTVDGQKGDIAAAMVTAYATANNGNTDTFTLSSPIGLYTLSDGQVHL